MNDTRASDEPPPGAPAASGGYWFTPLPTYLLDAAFDPESPVNGSAAMLWAHLHRNYAWRKRVFPSYATLARETDQSESAVKRQMAALRQVGAIEWGANYGPKGRSSNEYALAPHYPFDFDRSVAVPVEVKNDPHRPVEVRNDLGVEVISDTNPQVKNDLGVKSTEELEISLSSAAPAATPEPTVTDEREIFATDQDLNLILTAYAQALGRPVASSIGNDIRDQAAKLLADGLPLWWLMARAKELPQFGTDLAKHCNMSRVPVEAQRPDGQTAPCTAHGPFERMVRNKTGDLVNCPDCHPAELARRQRQGAA